MHVGGKKVRTTMAAVATLIALGTVSGCGADPSPYCQAVDENKATLDGFGAKKTEKAFTGYSRMLRTISKVAPEPIDLQWASLGRATQGILTAHDAIGFPLEDMTDEEKRSTLSAGDVEVLDKAYKRFNGTTSQRKAVVADVAKTCDITLK